MPMLGALGGELERKRPFAGSTIGICLHVEPKTAVLCSVLRAGGADVVLTGSPGTTQDEVGRALAEDGIMVYGRRDDDATAHRKNIASVLEHRPRLLLDNGADLVASVSHDIVGATEETTTGANRLREELAHKVTFPVIVINDSPLKSIVENQHGVGQTIVEGFMRTTNVLIPARRFVVIGYGWCGRGVARYLKSFGARIGVIDTDPIRSLEAALDGMRVFELEEALVWADVFITVTGRPDILRREHFERMRDGVILANAGHFSWEIDLKAIRDLSAASAPAGEGIERFELVSGKKLYVLTRGEMLNLAGGGGNPIETMDLGLSLQTFSLMRIATDGSTLAKGPQPVPADINQEVARRMLEALKK
jgi:adenosylhomocysteinase